MKKGDKAVLRMQRTLIVQDETKATAHSGSVLKYDESQECLYLLLESGDLTKVSLDAVCECEIISENECTSCTGRVRERYCGNEGKIIKFQIENGFYKINIKCVDKQKA